MFNAVRHSAERLRKSQLASEIVTIYRREADKRRSISRAVEEEEEEVEEEETESLPEDHQKRCASW